MAIVRGKDGKLQMRRAQPGKLTREAEQAFLAAVSATCNLSLAAAAVGSCFRAFDRRRKSDPAFARELRLALKQGYETLETGLLAAGLAGSREHDDWRSNEPPAMPPMTANQALQLMYLHHKEARLNAVEPHQIRRRAREPEEAYHERLVRMAAERLRRQQEEFEVAEVARWERGEPPWGPAGAAVRRELGLPALRDGPSTGSVPPQDERDEERDAFGLPDLAQVTGWSRADPAKAPHDPRRALFGGWRIGDMERRLKEGRGSESRDRVGRVRRP